MLRLIIIFYAYFGILINVQAETEKEVIYDALSNARYFDEAYRIDVPWDGYNTNTLIHTPIPTQFLKSGDLVIRHPLDYSLFIDDQLFYRSVMSDSTVIPAFEILKHANRDTIRLTHSASVLNKENFGVWVLGEDADFAPGVLNMADKRRVDQTVLFLHLLVLLAYVLVRTLSAREFEFYFSGLYIRSPRLSLEKFMGDSLNPLLIFLSALTVSLILIDHIDSLNLLRYQKLNLDFINTNSRFFSFLLVLLTVILYLGVKRTFYFIYMWLKQQQREFSGVWRSYLLSFTNLTFWFFLLYTIPLLLFPNFEIGKFFQIIFFIFAALNAVGGIMVYSNFRIKADLITISGILAIDIFPIILLVQLLTF